MFTIPTLPKLLLIVLVIGAVWWFYRRSQIKRRQQDELDRKPRTRAKTQPAKPIEDMKQCRVCSAYVPAVGASRCGRENCPF
jgi:uncharacterized protein